MTSYDSEKSNFIHFLQKLLWDLTTARKLALGLLTLGIYTFLLVYLHLDVFKTEYKLTGMVHSILGLALGLLMVFRTNTAYDKWWEGRKLLGALVNNSRNLAIKIQNYFPNPSDRTHLKKLLSAYPLSLRNHLRDNDKLQDIHLSAEQANILMKANHAPNALAKSMYHFVSRKNTEGELSDIKFLSLDTHLQELTNIIGACERIKNTPLPKAYVVHLRQFLNLYMFTLPFPLVHELGYWSILVIMVIFYALAGVKNIGEEIEQPFGTDANDLPLDSICERIVKNIEEISQTSNLILIAEEEGLLV